MAQATIGTTPAKATQAAVDTANGSNKPLTGSPQQMLNNLPTRHPIDVTKF
jgi:hypothetical protein